MRRSSLLSLNLMIFGTIALALPGGIGGCGSEVPTAEGFVPDVQGAYTRTAITQTAGTLVCTDQFDTAIEVIQSEGSIIVHGTNGIGDSTGTVDKDGVLALVGSFTNTEEYECTGIFADDVLSTRCSSDSLSCSVTFLKQ